MLIDESGNAVSDPQRIADIFQDQFKSVFSTPLTQSQLNHYSLSPSNVSSSISCFEVTQGEIIAAIDEMKGNASCPTKDVPAQVFKQCKLVLSKPLFLIWKKSFLCGEIPNEYKNQMIIPVHKKGSKTLAKNFRPISLTSHEVKIMERVLRKRITNYLENFNLINDSQHGFRRFHSCTTQLLSQLHYVLSNSVEGLGIDSIYIDYAKAFDKVDHGLLLKKLQCYGIVGKYFHWIKNFLHGSHQATKL